MTSAPLNLYTARTANKPAKVRVFLGPADGSSSDDFTERFDLIPLEILRIAGSRPDYAVFEFDTQRIVSRAHLTATVTGFNSEISFNRQIYVEVGDAQRQDYIDPDTGDLIKFSQVIFWGELLTETLRVDSRTQRTTIAARVADYPFGDRLESEKHYDHNTNAFIDVELDPSFNPLIDGIIEKNMSKPFYQLNAGYPGYSVWVDPESQRTQKARWEIIDEILQLNNTEASTGENDLLNDPVLFAAVFESNPDGFFVSKFWTLTDIVDTLSQMLLGGTAGDFILPGFQELAQAADVENLVLPRGEHLPRILDRVLQPFGYDWYLDPSGFDPALIAATSGANGKPELGYFFRGDGTVKQLHLQPAGEFLDPTETETQEFRIETDVGNLANEIRGAGSLIQKEVTINLFRGWETDDDSLTAEDLRRSDPASEYNANNKTAAWRLFVANEAGDYSDVREPGDISFTGDILVLDTVFDTWLPVRREIEDCLTLDDNGKRRTPFLEYQDEDNDWNEVPPEWGWVIERDQIAVRFTGDTPPEEMIDIGEDFNLRITCTITGDERLFDTSTPSLDESPNLRTVPLFLDLSDRYHKRSVQTSGVLASVLAGDSNGADEVDDTADLQAFLADNLDHELSAEMRCEFRLHGLHTEFGIGDLIDRIAGRDIYLNRNKHDPTGQANKKRVQVYGVRWLPQEQVTELIVEAIDNDVQEVDR